MLMNEMLVDRIDLHVQENGLDYHVKRIALISQREGEYCVGVVVGDAILYRRDRTENS